MIDTGVEWEPVAMGIVEIFHNRVSPTVRTGVFLLIELWFYRTVSNLTD
jgi:hypothetical protein